MIHLNRFTIMITYFVGTVCWAFLGSISSLPAFLVMLVVVVFASYLQLEVGMRYLMLEKWAMDMVMEAERQSKLAAFHAQDVKEEMDNE